MITLKFLDLLPLPLVTTQSPMEKFTIFGPLPHKVSSFMGGSKFSRAISNIKQELSCTEE